MTGRLVTRELVSRLRTRFALRWQGIHGASHWARVRWNGLALAEHTGANRTVVELFFCMAIVLISDAPNLSASEAGTLT